MKWSLVQRGLFFVCRGGPNAYIMQLKFMGWAYKKEAAAQFICATAPKNQIYRRIYLRINSTARTYISGVTLFALPAAI